MPAADTAKEKNAEAEKIDYREVPGFHVVGDDNQLFGTYQSEDDAQAFIDGHLSAQKVKAKVVEGTDAGE